ncbi:MAG: sulfite exporter TauE/SafE family protein [Candidatus Sericytochromatia bacterium]
MIQELLILSTIIFFASFTEALSGFGTVIISVTFGIHFFPIELILSIIVPMNLILSTYVVSRNTKHINFELLIKKILPFMSLGLLLGLFIFNYIQGNLLKKIYGFLIVILSIYQLNKLLTKKEQKKPKNAFINFMIFLGGVIHGIYASGGPMIVYALSNEQLTKERFRANLSTVWLFFNTILTIIYIFTGKITETSFKFILYLIPSLLLGILVGDLAHKKIKEENFKIFIFSVLILAGASILFRK